MGDDKLLKELLQYTISDSTISNNTNNNNNNSIIRILVTIDKIQNSIIEIILQQLPQCGINEFEEMNKNYNESNSKLIINRIRWLDHLVDSIKVKDFIIQIIPLCNSTIQQEIIVTLPEIVDDSVHESLVNNLIEFVEQDSNLLIPIIESISNFNLSNNTLDKIRVFVFSSIHSISLDKLPVIVKFLLQSVTTNVSISSVIHGMRLSLQLETISLGNDSQLALDLDNNNNNNVNNNNINSNEDKGSEGMIIETIKSAIRFNKEIGNAYLKEIQSIENKEDFKILDFIIIIIFCSINQYKKQAENIIKKKINSNIMNEEIIKKSIKEHTNLFKDNFNTMITIADNCLRSIDILIINFGSILYITMYILFETYNRQTIIHNLLEHVGSGTKSEIDASLHILLFLVENHKVLVRPFTVFVKSIIDFLFNLDDLQVRKVYQIISNLVNDLTTQTSGFGDELNIMIRKQITSTFISSKRIGIMGTVALIRTFSLNYRNNTSSNFNKDDIEENNDSNKEEEMNAIKEKIELIIVSTKKHPLSFSFFCDELSTLMEKIKIPTELTQWLLDFLEVDWQNKFLEDESEKTDSSWLEINDNNDNNNNNTFEIEINKYTTSNDPNTRETINLLTSLFKLYQITIYQINGNLSSIGQLLIAPISIIKQSKIKQISTLDESQQESICLSLFYGINWLRELVNAFSNDKDIDVFHKVLIRLQHVKLLESKLTYCLAYLNQITLPIYTKSGPTLLKLKDTKKKSKSKSNKEDKESNKDKENEQDDDNDVIFVENSNNNYLELIIPYFREFNVSNTNYYHNNNNINNSLIQY